MNNITKNLLLALTLVCVLVLVVFCIQLIVLNRGVDPRDPGATISGGNEQNGADADNEDEDADDGDEDEDTGPDLNTPRPPPQGRRHSLLVTGNSRLIIHAREDLFEYEERDYDWWFYYIGGGAALEVTFTSVSAQGISAHAVAVLNTYTGGTDADFSGEEIISGSEIKGYHVSARQDNVMYEAWIHTLIDSDLSLLFVIYYENDTQRDALYEVLSTMHLTGADDGGANLTNDNGAGTDSTDPDDSLTDTDNDGDDDDDLDD